MQQNKKTTPTTKKHLGGQSSLGGTGSGNSTLRDSEGELLSASIIPALKLPVSFPEQEKESQARAPTLLPVQSRWNKGSDVSQS